MRTVSQRTLNNVVPLSGVQPVQSTSEENKVDCQNGLAPKPLPKLLQMELNLFWLHVASSETAKPFQDDDVLPHSRHGE